MSDQTTAVVFTDAAISSADIVAYLKDPGQNPLHVLSEDPEQVAARIEAQEMAAQSIDQLLGGEEVLHAKDVLGHSFQLLNCQWRPSDQAGGLPVFGVFTIAMMNGDIHTLVCGARSVVRKAAIADAKGWLPAWVKIVEGKPTANGTPLDLAAGTAPVRTSDGGSF